MFMSTFILMFSIAALLYWVRASIVTMLEADHSISDALRLAEANRLQFPMIRMALATAGSRAEYGHFADSLRYDFQALTYLLRFAATVNVGHYTSQERLLVADFHMMRMVYTVGSMLSPRAAHYALSEMTAILEHFAANMSGRMSTFALDVVGA